MNLLGIQLTSRDIEIIRFINEFGFCEMPQIERRFAIKKPLSYRLMRRLIRAKLVNHMRFFHMQYGIYYLTTSGAKFTNLPSIEKASLGGYEHQMMLTDVYLKLKQQYPDTDWISERQLKLDKFYDGVGKSGHLADGILVFPDGKQVAIEVELSLKSKKRVEKIFRAYATQFEIKEVWYYCPKKMLPKLCVLAAKMSFIKIHNLTDFLA